MCLIYCYTERIKFRQVTVAKLFGTRRKASHIFGSNNALAPTIEGYNSGWNHG